MSKYDTAFCLCFPCGVDEGPCFIDDQCKDNLNCGYKNCLAPFDDNDNCCTKKELLKSTNFPFNYPHLHNTSQLITANIGSIIILQFHFFHVRLIVESSDATGLEKLGSGGLGFWIVRVGSWLGFC